MITVIIAGGSGTRLWPLSTSQYPKHLLRLTGEESLLQKTYSRAKRTGDTVYIVTESSHAHHVKEQLPDLGVDNFLIEPGRRGTGNCIMFALDVISRRHDHDEPIAFIHSDHNVNDTDSYVQSLHLAASASSVLSKVTLIGIEPTSPSTAFGYIEKADEINGTGAYTIASFKEKPAYETALDYMNSGSYLWNCGYFVGSVTTFLSEIRSVAPDLTDSYNTLAGFEQPMTDAYNEAYLSFEDLVIDYTLSERSSNLAVVPASFDWMDIGNFKDLYGALPKDDSGNYLNGDNIYTIEASNAYVRNEEPSKPIAVIGLDDVVVVNTPDGILVAHRDMAARSGEVAKKVQAQS